MGNKVEKKKTCLTEEDIKMLEMTTCLTRNQILEWYQDFVKECKNGELNKKNFTRFYKDLMPDRSNTDKFCEFVFRGKTN